jgi:Glycosyl transferase family 2
MSEPLVSVCIPARGQARFLGEAIASALHQGIADLEVLVHDDASDDDLGAIARASGDRRVRYLRHERPLGVAENRNSCLRAARGRYVAWLDADDAYLPGALQRQVAVLERHPAVALVHGAAEIVDEAGARLPPWRRPFAADTIEPSRAAFRELLLANELTTSTVVVRSSAHAAAGPFVASGPSSSDWDMWLRLALHGDVAYGADPVAEYRQHAATISRATASSGARLRCDVRVVRRVLRLAGPSLPDRRRLAGRASAALAAKALLHAGDLQTRGDRAGTLRAVGLAARLTPGIVGGRLARLASAAARADAYGWHHATKDLLGRLAAQLEGSRFGARIAGAAARDPEWDATLGRIAHTLRAVTPADAMVGTVTKWDPTLLHLSGRRGRQFPDRRLLPDGYPADDAAAVAHLQRLRAEGLSHLVFPSASFWWLEHYGALAGRLRAAGPPAHADPDCVIFDLRAA